MRRGRWRPPPETPVLADEAVTGRTTPFLLAPGNPLRGASCCICLRAAGSAKVYAFVVITFHHPATSCGGFAATSWLAHAHHPSFSDLELLAIVSQRHRYCLEEAP